MKRSEAACLELAERYGLPATAAAKFHDLLGILRDDPAAPTSVSDPEQGRAVHVADSLSGLEVAELRSAGTVADVGSGAGLPGLVLAIALPGASFDLVEAAGKKCQFIERTAASLGLGNVDAIHDRAETWAAGKGAGAYDAVTVRAVAGLPTLLEYASPLLRVGGVLVAWKGATERDELLSAAAAAEKLAMSAGELIPVSPYPASRDRHLFVSEKTGPTPAGIPRRPGMAAKRPRG